VSYMATLESFNMMNLIEKIKNAGIIGAGGAGFPTHVKVDCKADIVIANGAECEPLLRVDQIVMIKYAKQVVEGMRAVVAHTGAKEGVICLKSHYHGAVDALKKEVSGNISLKLLKSYYPAGDEQSMVYDVTGKVVPTGGLPLDVGAVVINVSTLVNISEALSGRPVTDKIVTVGGEVENPSTFDVPVGTNINELIIKAGGPKDMAGYSVIIGGPCMGVVTKDLSISISKTTGGILVFKDNHSLLDKKKDDFERDVKLAKAVCCQCSLCTQICPRNALGLDVQPHKAMRAIANNNGTLIGETNGIFSCCDCGLCTYYACNFGLNPSKIMTRLKGELAKAGVRAERKIARKVDDDIEIKKVPVSRLISRLGIKKYDVDALFNDVDFNVGVVKIPLNSHIGAPAKPVVNVGACVSKGDLIAEIQEGKLGARVHASVTGQITDVKENYIAITR
jgi:Na+-translocating ferredoxin:NAD+ oxidoreductase RnfC subunit